jgi:arginase
MLTVSVPYHLDEFLGGFAPGPVDVTVAAELPAGDPWSRMAALYSQVADVVARAGQPVTVLSGDCTTSLGVLAGLQRAGEDPAVVWLDAHADFQTEATTASGYLGGMPLALATGVGELTLPRLLGLRPVPAATLVGARDVDPPEEVLLAESTVRRRSVEDLGPLPDGPLYLHVDLDVCDPAEVPDLLYPAPGGPALAAVLEALGQVVGTGRVAGVGLALTWRLGGPHAERHDAVRDAARDAVGAGAG